MIQAHSSRPFSDHSFEQFLGEERLMGSRCRSCNALHVPPRSLCPKCYGVAMQWEEMSGSGRLAAFTSIGIGPSFMADEGYDRHNPYCTGVIELSENARVVARIEGVDAAKPETIAVGTEMAVRFLHRGDADRRRTFLAFAPS